MSNEIATALIGVGATIAGTVLGWILNNLSNKGKLNIYVSSCKVNFLKPDLMGGMIKCSNKSEVEEFKYFVSCDLYNSSGNQKIMRDIKICFNDGKKDLKLFNCNTILNIPAKTVCNKFFSNVIFSEVANIDFIWKTKKIYLVYTNEKNKTERILIKEEDYSNYFENHNCEES